MKKFIRPRTFRGILLAFCGLFILPLALGACGDNVPVISEVPDNRPKLNPADYPPILFVHGSGDQASNWIRTRWFFESNAYPAERLFTISFRYPTAPFDGNNPGKAYTDNDGQRSQLAAKVDEVLAKTGAKKLALIANSRGGLTIRNYLERGGGASKVSHIILGGTPNHGVMDVPLIIPGNEFNASGDFQKDLNGRDEVVPGVDTMTIRSDTYDKYAQPRSLASPIAIGYRGPELKGALNLVLAGLDHRETAYHPRAFAQMYRFITGVAPRTTEVTPEANPRIGGLMTGYEDGVQTNIGVSGVKVSIFEVDSTTGQRKGIAVHEAVTGTDGSWGNFVGRPDAYYEFVAQPPNLPEYHFFRTPFPRSTELANFRLQPEKVEPGKVLVVFTRPRGFISNSRDKHLLDGKPVPGVDDGVPTTSAFKVDFSGPERSVPASLNGESMTIRTVNGAIVFAEFTN
ncbi:MAG: alpha/beta fold hydrolase [Chloroflexota bacterium]|nr:hypothetical protein [Chloroflexota bacterium]